MAVIVRKGPPPPESIVSCEWVQALHARARVFDTERGLNIVALAAWALGTPLVQVADDDTPWLWDAARASGASGVRCQARGGARFARARARLLA